MALHNLAKMTTATTGTGTITLGSAVSGGLTFALAGAVNGEVVSYGITDGANSETGTGTYTTSGTTLTRTVTKSTNSDAAISLSGSAVVFLTARAEDIATLGANTFTGAQVHNDQQVSREMLLDSGNVVVDKGSIGSGTVTFDYTGGSVQTWTNTGAHTVATSNWPPTGNLGELLLIGTNLNSAVITWPTINWIKPDGTTTTAIATYLAANIGRGALRTSGVDQILLWSRDAGTTVYGKLI